ncbi:MULTISPECIES: hypothetical protein [Exiguobacterium]|uniref:hypothetical protein n=1 Tax=Exiguobacterium TaxID=33986 RepID=UPI001BEB6820|nr:MULTISPECIES: hypothetical protein [Exiguobacterium]MCT4776790.1 hypothetical protein [Exiguobacterium aquaticum]MCT4790114.1 hypothetical protein [Exiguobacterium mexicanum]
MKQFLLIHRISVLLGLTLCLAIQLFANSGRLVLLVRDAAWPILCFLLFILLLVAAKLIIRFIQRLRPSTWNVFLYVLYFPYLFLFTYGWTRIIPAPNEAAWPSPAVGLFIIALTFTFPLYVFIVHMVARSKQPSM